MSHKVQAKLQIEDFSKLEKDFEECSEIKDFSYNHGKAVILTMGAAKPLADSLRNMESVKEFLIEKELDVSEAREELRELMKRRNEPEHEIMDSSFMCNRLMLSIDKEEAGERCPFCNQPTPVLEVTHLD